MKSLLVGVIFCVRRFKDTPDHASTHRFIGHISMTQLRHRFHPSRCGFETTNFRFYLPAPLSLAPGLL